MAFGIALAPLAAHVESGCACGTFLAIASGIQTIWSTDRSIRDTQIQKKKIITTNS